MVLAAAAVSLVSLLAIRLRFGKVDPRGKIAEPKGRASAGILYAFTAAFLPWKKESARRHLLSYLAGVAYHLAIFLMLALLIVSSLEIAVPVAVWNTSLVVLLPGLACGAGLLIKRIVNRRMRSISFAEDYFANLLVTSVLALAILVAFDLLALSVFQVAGALLLLYIPLGKLRHMLFLLTSRFYWGAYYGRRGVMPYADHTKDLR